MGKKFEAGDLALIVADGHEANIGRVVELLFFVADGGRYESPEGRRSTNMSGGGVWIVSAEGLLTKTRMEDWRVAGWTQKSPGKLMPLRGDLAPERQKSRSVPA